MLDIFAGFILGMATSYIFWFLTFWLTRTKVNFSDKIQKFETSFDPNKFGYRIKVINTGYRDLVEISIIARMTIDFADENDPDDIKSGTSDIAAGSKNQIPALRGRRFQYKNRGNDYDKKSRGAIFLLFSIPGDRFGTYIRGRYSEAIKEKAKEETLRLEDFFEEYKDRVQISVFIFGNDRLTGARKMYEKRYNGADGITESEFGTFRLPKNRMKYKERAEEALAFEEEDEIEKITSGNEENTPMPRS